MTAEAFRKLSKEERYRLAKVKATHLANRVHGGFQIGLFYLDGLYFEVWKRFGLNIIDYIEPVDESKVRNDYLDNLDLPGL
jgi:hypothetical protein